METKAQKALKFINEMLDKGLTVYISTMLKTTKVTPKTAASWKKANLDLFKIDAEGNLRIGSGKNYNIIVTKTTALVKIKAF